MKKRNYQSATLTHSSKMANYSKYVKMMKEAADKGLDLSTEARLARAAEQGYITSADLVRMAEKAGVDQDTIAFHKLFVPYADRELPYDFYHGTAGDFGSLNPNYGGASTGAASAARAMFASNLSQDANFYAKLAEEQQPRQQRAFSMINQLNDKIGEALNAHEIERGVALKEYPADIEALREKMNMIASSDAARTAHASVLPVHVRTSNPKFLDMKGETYGSISRNLRDAQAAGHDSVIFHNILDPEMNATHIAVFDPAQVRSKFAIFDPDKKDSRNLLAGVGAGIGIDGMQDEEPQGYAAGGVVKKAAESLFLHGKPGTLLNEVGGMEVLKNPKYKELLQLANESEMADDIGEKAVRVLKSPEGDLYAWPSAYLDHQSIADEVLPGFDIYANDAADNFLLKNGKLKSYNLGEEHGHDSIPEDLNAERLKKFLYSLMAAPALQEQEQKYAKGGYVEAKAGGKPSDSPYDKATIDAMRAAYKNFLNDATLSTADTTKATIGSIIAKATRPELFEDISLDDLNAAAEANLRTERHRLSDEHPIAAASGSLATLPIWMTLGGNSLLGQVAANTGSGAINRYEEGEDVLDPLSIGIEAGLPTAMKYWRPALKAAAVSLPALAHSDNSLFNLDNIAHNAQK